MLVFWGVKAMAGYPKWCFGRGFFPFKHGHFCDDCILGWGVDRKYSVGSTPRKTKRVSIWKSMGWFRCIPYTEIIPFLGDIDELSRGFYPPPRMPVGLRFRLGSWLWRLKMVTKIPDKKSGQGSVPSWANPGVRTPSLSARLWVDDVCFSKGGICDPVRNCFPQKMALWRHGCSWVSLGVTLQRWDMFFFENGGSHLPWGKNIAYGTITP